MGKINSRAKGCRGERMWRDFLRSHGFDAERGQQRSGSPDSPDVKCPALAGFHCEVKFVERLNLYDAMLQASMDAGEFQVPYVAHKKSHHDFLVTMRADDWIELVKEAL